MVSHVQQGHELGAGLLPTGRRGVAVAGGIGRSVLVQGLQVLHLAVPPAMVVAVLLAEVVGVGIAAVRGEHVVKVENKDVMVRVGFQPIVEQPVVERAGVGRRLGAGLEIRQRRRGDDDEELVLVGGKVGQQVVVDALGVAHGVIRGPGAFATEGIGARRRRVVRLATQVGVGEAGLEHDDLVLAAGVAAQARVAAVLPAFGVQRSQVGVAVWPGEPVVPMADFGVVADGLRARILISRPPTVVGITDKVAGVAQGDAQAAVAVAQPVLAGGVMDEDELDRRGRRRGIRRQP